MRVREKEGEKGRREKGRERKKKEREGYLPPVQQIVHLGQQ